MEDPSYLICSTPRTGSTLLCSLLEAAGVAGRPQSYFRKEDFAKWAKKWGLAACDRDQFGFAGYLSAAINAGRTGNGVFAARIMWDPWDISWLASP